MTARGLDYDGVEPTTSQMYQVELRIPEAKPSLPIAEKIARHIGEQIGSPHRVRTEVLRGRNGNRYTFFVDIDATDRGEAVSVVVATAVDVYRYVGLEIPHVYAMVVTSA